MLQWIREQAGSENCWGPGKLRRRQEKGGEGVADDASFILRIRTETHLNGPSVLCCPTLKKYVNIRALPEVTFTIHGVPYSLQPTVCTLLVRPASLFCKSQAILTHLPLPLFKQPPALRLPPPVRPSLQASPLPGAQLPGWEGRALPLICRSAVKRQPALHKPFNEVS